MLVYYCILLLLASSQSFSFGINLHGIPPVTLPDINSASLVPVTLPTNTCEATVRKVASEFRQALMKALDDTIDTVV
ncbi:hypothetical protein Aduo_000643 [Ancylostoma duodenale]